jgi:acyl-CoA thioesterase II
MEYAEDLATTLELEQLDRDLFRGVNTVMAKERSSLFGGQVCAQALMAAALTVAPDRQPHSLHGYFLRPGQIDKPVLLHVDRDRDGKSFSARHVAAVQDGEVIFSMLASFHGGGAESRFDDVGPGPSGSGGGDDAPPPEDCPAYRTDRLLEIRQVTLTEVLDGQQLYSDSLWIRAAHPLPDDRLVQACALAYTSDLGTGFGRVQLPGVGRGGPSIDHALWFHEPIRADDWVLLQLWPWKATPGRGLYRGALRDRDHRLGATVAQEHLLRD